MNGSDIHFGSGIEDPKTRTPLISLALAYSAMLPIAAGTIGALAFKGGISLAAECLAIRWAGATLCFLSGVRRGLSFRQKSGPTAAQLGSMLWLFVLGAGSLLTSRRTPALLFLVIGYCSEAALDPIAARRREAPRYFARLRPLQLAIPISCLSTLLAKKRRHSRVT